MATLRMQPSGNLELCSKDTGARRALLFTEAGSLRTDLLSVSESVNGYVTYLLQTLRRKMILDFTSM